jgi:hypothetical protein
MSNEMNNEHDKTEEKELQQKLSKAYKDASDETTTSKLDASIMAMAQQEVDARAAGSAKKTWWDRLKMPVSISAALVVTVGIARFMIELGYYNPNQVANQSYQRSTEVVLKDDSFVESDRVLAAPAPERKEMAESRAKLAEHKKQVEAIRVTGSRISREDVERARQLAEEEHRLAKKAEMAEVTAEELEIEQSQAALASTPKKKDDLNQSVGEDNSANGQREVADMPYLPAEEWIKQIEQLLEQEKNEAAKEQWLKFKQVYPDYSVEKPLYQRLQGL